MGEVLDSIARTVAAGGSRRDALKKIGGVVAGALLAGLFPKDAQAGPVDPCGGRCLKTQCCNGGSCVAKCPDTPGRNGRPQCCNGGQCREACDGTDCCDTVTGVCVANGKCPGPNSRPGCCDRATSSPLATCLAACPAGAACVSGTCPCSPSQCLRASAGHACLPNGACGCSSATDCPAGAICTGGACGPCSTSSQCPTGQACTNGVCGTACSASSPCNTGCCNGGVCAPTCPGGTCCSGGVCVTSADATCGSGGACVACTAPTPHCSPSFTCVECNTAADCVGNPKGGVCLANQTCGCNSLSDCPSGKACSGSGGACTTACSSASLCNGVCCSAASGGTCVPSCSGTGASCGGGGTPGVCGCTPDPQATTCNGRCGMVANNCGQTVTCGACSSGSCCESTICVTRNTQTDPNNCGACGISCAANDNGHACINGACACSVASNCSGSAQGSACVSGICACNETADCPLNKVCDSHVCTCPDGFELVHGGCFQIADRDCNANCDNGFGSVDGSGNFLCAIQSGTGCSNNASCPTGQACYQASSARCLLPC